MTQAPVREPPTETAQWGSIGIPYTRAWLSFDKQLPNALRTGSEVDRSSMEGLMKAEVASLSGGLQTSPRIQNWQTSLDKLYYNQGLQHQVPGVLCHPYALTTQATLIAANFSGYRAANKAVHGFNTNKGQSKLRFVAAVGPYILTTTSDSDPTLKVVYTGTNNIMSVGEIVLNNVRYPAFGTDGQTQDTFGIASINADPVVWTELITHAAGDVCNAMADLSLAGLSYNGFYGRFTNDGLFYAPHDSAIPIASASLLRMIKTSTRAVYGSLATAVTAASVPTGAGRDTTVGDEQWTDQGNIFSDNAATAKITWGGDNRTSGRIAGYGFFTESDIPPSAVPVGIVVNVDWVRTGANGDKAKELEIYLTVNGAAVGFNKSTGAAIPNGVIAYGSTSDLWGYAWARQALMSLGVQVRVEYPDTAPYPTTEIDYISVTVTYRLPGAPIDLPVGGRNVGLLPTDPSRWALLVPEADELTTVVMPRKLVYVDIEYDAAGRRVTGEVSYPNTMGLTHVEGASNGLGGTVVWGDNSSGIATSLRLIRGDGEPIDLRFPASYNGKACGIVSASCQGRFIRLEVAFGDATDTQLWYYFDSRYYASNLIQSKSNAIASLPLAFVGEPLGSELRRWHRFFPVSTTHLAAARCFVARDLLADPLVTNTGEAKFAGVLYADSPKMNLFGPTEANKTLNVIQYQGDQISTLAAATYGTVRYLVVTDGDRAFASAEVDTGALTDAFKTYNIPSAGVAIGPDKTVIIRYQLDNTGISTKTPNALPVLFTGMASWPVSRTWNLLVDTTRLPDGKDWESWLQGILNLSATKAVQPLRIGSRVVPAALKDMNLILMAAHAGQAAQVYLGDGRSPPTMAFSQKPGQVTA